MSSITTAQEATLLQLQYTAESCGLRRKYLQGAPDRSFESAERHPYSIDSVLKPVDTIERPDIDWYPSFTVYQKRVARLAELAASRPTTVPEGFPEAIDGPRVWTGSDFDNPDKYLVHLSDTDISEIKDGLAYFKNLPGDNGPDAVNRETFPLPTLGSKLVDVSKQLHFGTGFAVIRGLDPQEYSPFDNVVIYLGITSYIAEIRGCQDYDGRMLVHIKDIERDLPEAIRRPSPYTSRAQPFHNDRCDILAMYVLDVAVAGGESLLASAGKIYNEIAASRPDVIHVLADDKWIFDEFRKTPTWHTRQLLHNFKTHGPGFCYSRRPLIGAPWAPHAPGIPAMTEVQAEALDMVHFTAQKHQLSIKLQRGDIEIFNNFALFHARNGFVDDRSSTRHMLRLWLKSKDFAWETPEPLLKSSWEIYGSSEYRAIGKWDVHRAPPINRRLTRRMSCS